MSDNTTLNTGTGGDTIRDIDRGTAKTQVVQLDAGGEAGESLVSAANPLPVVLSLSSAVQDLSTQDAQSGEKPVTAVLVGDPSGNYAGENLLERVVEEGSGFALNARVLNPTGRYDPQGGAIPSDAPTFYQFAGYAPANIPLFVIDTTGYQSLAVHLISFVGSPIVYASNDQTNWVLHSGMQEVGSGVSSTISVTGIWVFPTYLRFIKIQASTVPGALSINAYLRASPAGQATPVSLTGAGASTAGNVNLLAVGGPTATGSSPSSLQPVYVAGLDVSGKVRPFLLTASGAIAAGLDQFGTQRELGLTAPAEIPGVPLLATRNAEQFEGQTMIELLGQILSEQRIANLYLYLLTQDQNLDVGDPTALRSDQTVIQ
jgi:hypothetical protein